MASGLDPLLCSFSREDVRNSPLSFHLFKPLLQLPHRQWDTIGSSRDRLAIAAEFALFPLAV